MLKMVLIGVVCLVYYLVITTPTKSLRVIHRDFPYQCQKLCRSVLTYLGSFFWHFSTPKLAAIHFHLMPLKPQCNRQHSVPPFVTEDCNATDCHSVQLYVTQDYKATDRYSVPLYATQDYKATDRYSVPLYATQIAMPLTATQCHFMPLRPTIPLTPIQNHWELDTTAL